VPVAERENQMVNKNDYEWDSGTIRKPSGQQDDWVWPWPLNLVGRQLKKIKTDTGWRRAVGVLGVGCEVVLIVAVIVLIIV